MHSTTGRLATYLGRRSADGPSGPAAGSALGGLGSKCSEVGKGLRGGVVAIRQGHPSSVLNHSPHEHCLAPIHFLFHRASVRPGLYPGQVVPKRLAGARRNPRRMGPWGLAARVADPVPSEGCRDWECVHHCGALITRWTDSRESELMAVRRLPGATIAETFSGVSVLDLFPPAGFVNGLGECRTHSLNSPLNASYCSDEMLTHDTRASGPT